MTKLRSTPTQRKLYRCIVSFGGTDPKTGAPNDCSAGTIVSGADPRVKANKDWFTPIDPDEAEEMRAHGQ